MKHRIWSLVGLLLLLPPLLGEKKLRVDFKEFKLENGLRVIIAEDHSAPVFSICVTYNVGSRDEKPGRTGFAHLFEHMMFKGSENVGPGEHFVLIFNNGGNMNGTTSSDRTNYFETLPANQLDLALFLEADRMRSLEVTRENLDNQRHAVQEERRLGLDNQPYGKTFERLQELAYQNFAYSHSTIGSMEDLNAATLDDVREFFRIYYAPNNATVTIVGDLDTEECLKKVKQYFGSIPRQDPPPPLEIDEPEQRAEKRETLEDKLARLPRVDMAYKIPPGDQPDYYALSVLGSILSSGQSSRFQRDLVRGKEVAVSIFAFAGASRGPGLFRIGATPRAGHSPEDVDRLIEEQLERIRREGVTVDEIGKARSFARRSYIQGLQSSLSRAIRLGQYAVFYGDPNLLNTYLDHLMAVTAEDVKRVANRYLKPEQKTVIITVPATTRGE